MADHHLRLPDRRPDLRAALGDGLLPTANARGKGWDRQTFGLAMALQNLFWGLGLPLFGAIADRFGTWRVLAIGGVIYASGWPLAWRPPLRRRCSISAAA